MLVGVYLNFPLDNSRPFDFPDWSVWGVFRLNTDGSRDEGFQYNGMYVSSLAVAAQSKIIVAGDRGLIPNEGGVFRLNTNGTVDATFFSPTIGSSDPTRMKLAIQPDGKIVVGGSNIETVNGGPKSGVFRLNENGSLDVTFDAPPLGEVTDIKLQSDGKIVILTNAKFLLRLRPNGSLDPTLEAPPSNNNLRFSIDIDSSDRIYIPEPQVMRLSGRLRVKVPKADIPVVLERTFNFTAPMTWSPLQTIPANTEYDFLDPNYPNDPSLFRVRPAN